MADTILDNARNQQAAMMPIPDALPTAIKQLSALKKFKDELLKRFNYFWNHQSDLPDEQMFHDLGMFYDEYGRDYESGRPQWHSIIQDIYNWFYDAIGRKFGNGEFQKAIDDYEDSAVEDARANKRSDSKYAALRYARKNLDIGNLLDVPEGYKLNPLETIELLKSARLYLNQNWNLDKAKTDKDLIYAWYAKNGMNGPIGLHGPTRGGYNKKRLKDSNGKYLGQLEVADDPVRADQDFARKLKSIENLELYNDENLYDEAIEKQLQLIAEGMDPRYFGHTFQMDHKPTLSDYEELKKDYESLEPPFKPDWASKFGHWTHNRFEPYYNSPRRTYWE